MGMFAISPSTSGVALSAMGYSFVPIFAVPVGTTRFCAEMAALTSRGDSPQAKRRWGSMSIMIWRCLPPHGHGSCAPWIVAMSPRMKFVP